MKDGLAVDRWLLFAVTALVAIGITMVLSTSYLYAQERFGDGTYFFRKQLIAIGVGTTALVICSMIPPLAYRHFAYPLLALTVAILVLVLVPAIGVARGGARRWLALPGFAFQPAEMAKLTMVFYLAHSMAKKEGNLKTFSIGVLPHLLVAGVLIGALLLEPDFGSAFILALLLYL
ncbi:MAG TPA: FtsW/RodA/SpoVE family cell cycle protein, partial [Terriglobales bacterium]|nr:FtsW/RodA/SpoVE family cell cycle protein [Terriglobales bacterium]